VESLKLAQQATLETRDAKHEPRSLAEQRQAWLAQADEVLGGPQAVRDMVRNALRPDPIVTTPVSAKWVEGVADWILAVMEEHRSTWQIWHVRAEPNGRYETWSCKPIRVKGWSTCWSTRCCSTGRYRWHALTTASLNRRCYGGPTARRSTQSPDPTCSPPPASSMPSSGWSTPPLRRPGHCGSRPPIG
jgi:hypothetical protein